MCRFFVAMSWVLDISDHFRDSPVLILPRLRIVHEQREGETSRRRRARAHPACNSLRWLYRANFCVSAAEYNSAASIYRVRHDFC